MCHPDRSFGPFGSLYSLLYTPTKSLFGSPRFTGFISEVTAQFSEVVSLMVFVILTRRIRGWKLRNTEFCVLVGPSLFKVSNEY